MVASVRAPTPPIARAQELVEACLTIALSDGGFAGLRKVLVLRSFPIDPESTLHRLPRMA